MNIVTLNDSNKYIVVSITTYNNDLYFYFVDVIKNENVKFLKLNNKNQRLVELIDPKLVQILMPLFLKEFIN